MRKFVVLALLISLCIGGAAFAQGTMPTFCGTLSAADCTILTNSHDAMKTLDSTSFDLTVNATVTNAPNMTAPMTFNLVGSGSATGMSSVQNAMQTMQTNPAQFYVNALKNLDADLTLMLTLPPEVVQQMNSNMPGSITLQARLVDGVGYVNLDSLQPILKQPNLKGWGGLDLAGLLQAALERNPDLFKGMSNMDGADMSAMMQQFTDPTFLNQFITISRTDSGSGDTATFHITINFAALLSSPAMHDMMMQRIQAQGKMMTDAEIQQALAKATQAMQGMTYSLDEQIGTTDGFVHSIHGTFAFDSSVMMAAMATPDAASTTEPAPSISVDFTINFSNFNSAPAITAPTDVMMLPYQLLLGSLPTPVPTSTTIFIPSITPSPTAIGTAEVTAEPTSEATSTAEPTSESTSTVEPTSAATSESTAAVTEAPTTAPTSAATTEPTAAVTASS